MKNIHEKEKLIKKDKYNHQFDDTLSINSSYDENKLPWRKVILIGLILFGNTFSLLIVFPFLPFMTHDFFPLLHTTEIGYKAGYLGSSFSLGSLFAAYLWGYLADKYGRKPILIAGLIGTMISIIFFGLSTNFYMAICTRFLWGFLNGNIGVAKTYLSEILKGNINQAKGFAIIGMQAGLGRLCGPAIGGFLAKPAEKYNIFNNYLFRTFPYLLPCLIAGFVAFLGLLGTLFYLEETLPVINQTPRNSLKNDHSLNNFKEEKEEIVEFNEISDTISDDGIGSDIVNIKQNNNNNISVIILLKNPLVRITCSLYGLIASIALLNIESFPLWAITSYKDGGFNFSTTQIGAVSTISAPFEILYQIFLYPKIVKYYGILHCLQIALIGIGIGIFILPFTSWTKILLSNNVLNDSNNTNSMRNSIIEWTVLCITMNFVVLCRLTCFTNVFVLINNSTIKKYRGRVNGIGQTFASGARIISPTVGSILFAWSEGNHLNFPFNYHFLFNLTTLLSFLTYFLSRSLPISINKSLD